MDTNVYTIKNSEKVERSLVWNSDKKIYEVLPKVEESDIYWNNRKQINLNY